MNFAYLLLGSNLDDRFAMMNRAKEAISSRIGKISVESSVYESEPWGFESAHRFLNQVIKIETEYQPGRLLEEILTIEHKLGRFRANVHGYTSRLIDIDILFYNDEIISEDNLMIPHPKIPERMFALMPLAEIDRSLVHPGLLKSITDMIKDCPDKLNVYLYDHK
jgi:2-amino-4-hydroxy-6-hydroxymethyldihydropteridine diphosphokinase